MIIRFHHVSIIASSEKSIAFYRSLGFTVLSETDRGYDKIYLLSGYGITLEIYVDPKHPERVTQPEAFGFRHFGLEVDNLEETLMQLKIPAEAIREDSGKRYTFIHDPDSLPIELVESVNK